MNFIEQARVGTLDLDALIHCEEEVQKDVEYGDRNSLMLQVASILASNGHTQSFIQLYPHLKNLKNIPNDYPARLANIVYIQKNKDIFLYISKLHNVRLNKSAFTKHKDDPDYLYWVLLHLQIGVSVESSEIISLLMEHSTTENYIKVFSVILDQRPSALNELIRISIEKDNVMILSHFCLTPNIDTICKHDAVKCYNLLKDRSWNDIIAAFRANSTHIIKSNSENWTELVNANPMEAWKHFSDHPNILLHFENSLLSLKMLHKLIKHNEIKYVQKALELVTVDTTQLRQHSRSEYMSFILLRNGERMLIYMFCLIPLLAILFSFI